MLTTQQNRPNHSYCLILRQYKNEFGKFTKVILDALVFSRLAITIFSLALAAISTSDSDALGKFTKSVFKGFYGFDEFIKPPDRLKYKL